MKNYFLQKQEIVLFVLIIHGHRVKTKCQTMVIATAHIPVLVTQDVRATI